MFINEGAYMDAAVKTENINEVLLENVRTPILDEDEVLVEVNYCGVCGSDLHAYNHSKGYEFVTKPIILGHEISGKVINSGDKVENSLLNKNVIIESMHYCGKCDNCKSNRHSICVNNKVIGLHFDGGMAEYVKAKMYYVREIPDELSSKLAVLSEPMAVAIHAVKKAKQISSSQIVLVQGPGIIGFLTGLICISKGAKVFLSGLDKDYHTRLRKAESFGMIPHRSNVDELPEKVDIFFECSGSNMAVKDGFSALNKGGEAIFVALYEKPVNLFLTDLVRNEWPIISSYGCDPIDYEFAFELLRGYQNDLISHISYYDLADVEIAFKDSMDQKVLKSVLEVNKN